VAPESSGTPGEPTAPTAEGAPAQGSEPEATKDEARGAPAPEAAPKGLNITYRPTAEGLVISIGGLQLEPKATPVKLPAGWGVKLAVRARATDGRTHRVLTPDSGPLMVAIEIDRGGGKKEHIVDERKGDTETVVTAGEVVPLDRVLKHAITAGQSLTLYVGLWGLGADAEARKPIKKLFVVKMVAGAKTPQPVITPPL
jgi:hypothetical protein